MNQSIEDASRKEFKDLLDSMGYVSHEFYSKYEMNIAYEIWQASRQSSQSEPVAEVLLDEFNMKYIKWNAHHWSHVLSAGSKLYLAAPQQAIPSEFLDAVREVIRISDRKHDAWDKVKEYL
jgi:hypothetical protein